MNTKMNRYFLKCEKRLKKARNERSRIIQTKNNRIRKKKNDFDKAKMK